jgi:hypothetical protein
MGRLREIPAEVLAIHQRDMAKIAPPGGVGAADFNAMVRNVDRKDRSWRDKSRSSSRQSHGGSTWPIATKAPCYRDRDRTDRTRRFRPADPNREFRTFFMLIATACSRRSCCSIRLVCTDVIPHASQARSGLAGKERSFRLQGQPPAAHIHLADQMAMRPIPDRWPIDNIHSLCTDASRKSAAPQSPGQLGSASVTRSSAAWGTDAIRTGVSVTMS